MPSPHNEGHAENIFDSSLILHTAELSRSLKPKVLSSSPSASHSNYIREPPSPTHSSGSKPSSNRIIIMTTSTTSQMAWTKRQHGAEPDQYYTSRCREFIDSFLTNSNISRRETSDSPRLCSSWSDTEPELNSDSVLLSKQSLPLSAKAHSGPTQSFSSIPNTSSDPQANVSQHDIDLLPPLSAMSNSSLKDEETQLAPLPLEKMPAEERKKANNDRKSKAEDRVEVLAGQCSLEQR